MTIFEIATLTGWLFWAVAFGLMCRVVHKQRKWIEFYKAQLSDPHEDIVRMIGEMKAAAENSEQPPSIH